MNAKTLIDTYISFFEKNPRNHKRIANSPLIPENDPSTLFTSSGMQPLVNYLLGEIHPEGTRLVNVQNSFRAQDIDEIGDNRHTTFFRMLGNWSLGDYFKSQEIPWLWEFLTKKLNLTKEKLYITVFDGVNGVPHDDDAEEIWQKIFKKEGLEPKIFYGDVSKNWWSRSGIPENMPIGEPGGPDTEVYYKFDDVEHGPDCKGDDPTWCECGKFLEIANSVFMQYTKTESGFKPLPKQNVDFGGGLERLLAAVEEKSDVFATSLFTPIINSIENETGKSYKTNAKEMRIISDHLIASAYIVANGIIPSNRQQGYILRRLLRRAFDNFEILEGENITFVLEKIVDQYSQTDEILKEKFEEIKNVIFDEEKKYNTAKRGAKDFIIKKYGKNDDSAKPAREISADDAFILYSTHGLSPTQIKSLGFIFDEQIFAKFMEEHRKLSKTASSGMFKGGLADHSELTVMGHTTTHLLHKALRDLFGNQLHQTGSNITSERIRFDFNLDRLPTQEEIKQIENTVNEKIKENLPVHFEIMPLEKAKQLKAIGLFDDRYAKDVKVYFIGNYSAEFCGGPHVDFTGQLKRFKIIKVENIGKGQKRIYSKVDTQF